MDETTRERYDGAQGGWWFEVDDVVPALMRRKSKIDTENGQSGAVGSAVLQRDA